MAAVLKVIPKGGEFINKESQIDNILKRFFTLKI